MLINMRWNEKLNKEGNGADNDYENFKRLLTRKALFAHTLCGWSGLNACTHCGRSGLNACHFFCGFIISNTHKSHDRHL